VHIEHYSCLLESTALLVQAFKSYIVQAKLHIMNCFQKRGETCIWSVFQYKLQDTEFPPHEFWAIPFISCCYTWCCRLHKLCNREVMSKECQKSYVLHSCATIWIIRSRWKI